MTIETQMNRTLRVKLFGSLREFGDNGSAEIVVPAAESVQSLKASLSQYLTEKFPGKNGAAIVGDSAVADDKRVLTHDASLIGREWVAILPPVCGG